ncbi:hypothetical protein M413DRAFT_327562 [Hebeloma cylindrosporum]|uniref:Rad21/Rec8-like protein N-terminal domain-containing protein n=1 Tax=Hebeloma cylindrosporum TaxID=76867 RepID=A0A0C3CMN3_HEBCY|nr:hypothetical protein M413DRAFT_327562 [Hebeloma cylindrosporum h7]
MFYSETILSRRGPLGRVWLAAHMERKLSKSQTLQTDIEQSVEAIMGQEIETMALRLSGQLLLGVVRIYSRKAKYLLDDCNEALLKIKMAFRPGAVDLAEDQLTVNKTAITLQTNGLGLDLLLPDVDWEMDFEDRPLQRQGHHQAHIDDITLRTADDFHQFGANDPFDIGPSDGIGSQDFNDLDLGIHWDDEQNDKSEVLSMQDSVGVGRDAQIHRDSLEPDVMRAHQFGADLDILSHRSKSRDLSEEPFQSAMDMDIFPDVDLGDLGIGFDDLPPQVYNDNERTPSQTRSPSRASSPLTELPLTPPPLDHRQLDAAAPPADKSKKKPRDRKQIIDSVTELQNGTSTNANRGRAAGNANPLNVDIASITSQQHFLPRSSIVMRLLEIRGDPVNYFLPTQSKVNAAFYSAAPPGLAPELAQLFIRPVPGATSHKRKGTSPGQSPSKRPRRDGVEVARRDASLAPSEMIINGDNELPGVDGSFQFPDHGGAMDDYQLELPDVGIQLEDERARSVFTDRSRLSSLGPEGLDDVDRVVDLNCPVSIFDVSQPTQTQAPEGDQDQADIPEISGQGYSKNTIRALGLIRKELQPDANGDVDEFKTMSFKQMSTNASRRAAASFFFEMLVLGTRDCIQISQEAAFADIEVRAKPRLWQQQQHGENINAETVDS